jgi:hypothetical protein
LALLAGLAALASAPPPAAAHPESEAPGLDPRVAAAWHEPAVPKAGEQWSGFLRLRDGAGVAAVGYQACLVPGACIISPRPATPLGNNTWRFDTASYANPLDGRPYAWPAGTLGVRWFLAPAGGNLTYGDGQAFPQAFDAADPRCGDATACIASHYVTFEVASAPKQAPAPTAPLLALALALAALAATARRRMRDG